MVFPEICAAKRVEYLLSNIGSLVCSVHLAPVLYVIESTTDDPTVRTVSFAVASALLIASPVFSANTVVSTTIIEPGLAIPTMLGATGAVAANGALVGFVNGYFACGGDFGAALQRGIIGGVSGGVTDQIGHGGIFTGENAWFSQALAHGVFQGLISEIQGGEFQVGFASGFVAKVGWHYLEGTALDNVAGVSILGGLASKAAGGDFLQGAIQAALVYMYNDQNGGNKKRSIDDEGIPDPFKLKTGEHASTLASNVSTVVADGMGGMKVHLATTGDERTDSITLEGHIIHERQHIKDFIKYATNLNEVLGEAYQRTTLVFPSSVKPVLERRAYRTQINYLRENEPSFFSNPIRWMRVRGIIATKEAMINRYSK